MLNRFIRWGLFAGVLLLCGTLFFAAEHNRSFLVDGSFWFFQIIFHHSGFHDSNYIRWFNLVVQFPTVMFLKHAAADSTAQAVRLLNYSHNFFPVVSLALSACILYFRGHRHLILFPLLSFALATISTVAFSVGSVPNALSVFWPLYCLFLTRNANSVLQWLAVLALSFVLAITYETALLFFVLMAFILVFRFNDFKKEKVKSLLLGLCFSTLIVFLVYRIVGPAAGNKSGFIASLTAGLGFYQKYSVVILFLLSVSMWPFFQKSEKKWDWLFIILLPLGTLAASLYMVTTLAKHGPAVATMWDTFNSRVTAIPVALWLAFIMFVFQQKYTPALKKIFFARFQKALGISTVMVLFAAGFYDYELTRQSAQAEQYLNSVLATNKGCYKLSRKDYLEFLAPYGVADWSLPYASILLGKKADVDTVIFTEKEEGSFEKTNPCVLVNNRELRNDFDFEIVVRPDRAHFSFQKLLQLLPN